MFAHKKNNSKPIWNSEQRIWKKKRWNKRKTFLELYPGRDIQGNTWIIAKGNDHDWRTLRTWCRLNFRVHTWHPKYSISDHESTLMSSMTSLRRCFFISSYRTIKLYQVRIVSDKILVDIVELSEKKKKKINHCASLFTTMSECLAEPLAHKMRLPWPLLICFHNSSWLNRQRKTRWDAVVEREETRIVFKSIVILVQYGRALDLYTFCVNMILRTTRTSIKPCAAWRIKIPCNHTYHSRSPSAKTTAVTLFFSFLKKNIVYSNRSKVWTHTRDIL